LIPFEQRTLEARTLFNPAFLALIVREAARGHRDEVDLPLPFELAFLGVAIGTHDQIVESLPANIATSMLTWADRNPLGRIQIAPRAKELVPMTREAIRLGARTGALTVSDTGQISAGALRRGPGARAIREGPNFQASFFLGRWMARVGDPVTTLRIWGLTV
jgi:hypothetical protein